MHSRFLKVFLLIGPSLNEVVDRDEGINGTFEIFLEPYTDTFEVTPNKVVNEAKFLIRVKNSNNIDFEKEKVMNFNIIAREVNVQLEHSHKNGTISRIRESRASVTIHIKDANDNFPEFLQQTYEVDVLENVPIGYTLAKIQAFDIDSEDFGTKGIRYTKITGGIADL